MICTKYEKSLDIKPAAMRMTIIMRKHLDARLDKKDCRKKRLNLMAGNKNHLEEAGNGIQAQEGW